MDALKIEKAILGGFDWGARTANIVAALWPERVQGHGLGERLSDRQPGSRQDAAAAEGRARMVVPVLFRHGTRPAGYDKYRRDFSKLIWQLASPKWDFDDATFDRSAAAFDNPDHVNIVIHNYRWRLGLAEGEAKYDDLEKRLAHARSSACRPSRLRGMPTAPRTPIRAAYAKKFSGKYEHRLITGGIGHNLPQEAPQALRPGRHRRGRKLRQFQGLREPVASGRTGRPRVRLRAVRRIGSRPPNHQTGARNDPPVRRDHHRRRTGRPIARRSAHAGPA